MSVLSSKSPPVRIDDAIAYVDHQLDTCSIGQSHTDISNNAYLDEDSTLEGNPSTSTLGPTNFSELHSASKDGDICAVCGDSGAKMHYGVLACLGCKGFFRRALKKADQYECLNNNKCVIDKFERNSCRACRLNKSLRVGMDPAAVRPDRDFTGKQQSIRLPLSKRSKPSVTSNSSSNNSASAPKNIPSNSSPIQSASRDEMWKKLPVEMRTLIMNLSNLEIKICRGDTTKEAADVYPLQVSTIREVLEDPKKLKGKRTEMRYEPYRMATNEELHVIVYRRLIAAIDWVEYLSEMISGGLTVEDKIVLVKCSFGPLMLFKNAARTATVTEDENILCVCNFAYVPRNMAIAYSDAYHLDNGLVGRMLDELVHPLRKMKLSDEEMVCLSGIIVLNPMARDLSDEGSNKISQLRNKIQDTLYHYVKEMYPENSPTTRFGNLLLYIPILTGLANVMNENIRFAQTFSPVGVIPLVTSAFGCFPVESFLDSKSTTRIIRKSVETQTDDPTVSAASGRKAAIKRRLPSTFTSPVENEVPVASHDFRLLQPPSAYTITEMFDDRMNEQSSQNPQTNIPVNSPYPTQYPTINGSAPQLFFPSMINSTESMEFSESSSHPQYYQTVAVPKWTAPTSSLQLQQRPFPPLQPPQFYLGFPTNESNYSSREL